MDNRLLLAFYGDDFTGSTDAMEALDRFGLRTILFLEVPTTKMLNRFEGVQCIGVAGTVRAKDTTEMEKELIPVWEQFKQLRPYFVHYKICSTFDSSPEVGSIGYVSTLSKNYFAGKTYPLLAATPDLGRYTVFGNHFANFHDTVFRLDEHPVMSRHPVTPMNEADLGKHLQKQTDQTIGNVTVLDMEKNEPDPSVLEDTKDITVFDAMEEKHMDWFAELTWASKQEEPQFMIGSSGIEYALASKWKREGLSQPQQKKETDHIDKMLVVSGSVSDVTKRQLELAEQAGFHMVQVPYKLLSEDEVPESFIQEMLDALEEHKKVVLYTAKGPSDPVIEHTKNYLQDMGIAQEEIGIFLGKRLGEWTKSIMEKATLRRLIISGGDTSGFVTSQLGIYGLEVLESIAPGAPLCHAYSEDERFNGLEIALKSGQLGGEAFFENVYLAGKDNH
ncbi:four-carbon acid sugar kinase family protein [Salibacterium salarium]|uniref:Four-carbon acid sugar kinase family protein n=1 Tax=Salibacterium salarium TaxID=284579 RepID=A0A3R9RCB4_9BACI|nr:four-carbon acid sugar kinase family protein [Salibacterium salarium]RSL32187.1 four-carbon acid sugar kinase family protein [Salibacterium salarium]